MTTQATEQGVQTFEFIREETIRAPIDIAFEALLEQIGPCNEKPDGTPLPFKLEPWPGGRWWRDLGEGMGHFWGNVQAIKAPTLLEISGPLFMSTPAFNNIQYRLTEEGGVTRLKLVHRAMGMLPVELVREGMDEGWDNMLERVRKDAERRAGAVR
jgi:uncharacterized protein YndB with AHSA1/START domain